MIFLRMWFFFRTFAAAKAGNDIRNRVQKYNFFLKNTNYFVKKHLVYWVLLPLVLFSGRMSAEVNHYVGAYANAGEWSLLPSKSAYSLSLGAQGGLGAVYELQAGPIYGQTRFLFQVGAGVSVGVTAFSQSSTPIQTFISDDGTTPKICTDIQGDQLQYHYKITNRRDQYRDIALQVPLMVGVQHKAFYMLAGAKIYYHLPMVVTTTAKISTSGVYTDWADLGPTTDIPEYQFFNDAPYSNKGNKQKVRIGFGGMNDWDVDLALEIGGRFGYVTSDVGYDVPKSKIEYRLAGYIDYGISDIRGATKENKKAIELPADYDYQRNDKTPAEASMITGVTMNHIMSTDGFASKVNNLVIGLKFTVLFEMPKAGHCVLCGDNYRRTAKSSKGDSSRLQYEE